MRNQLISYIDLLFAGSSDTEDIKQEILQNTLDRYDDLVAQGKTPEAAYSLAISGIGDISEILNGNAPQPESHQMRAESSKQKQNLSKILQAIAVALFILCPVPVIVLQNVLGVVLLLVIVAVATGMIIISQSQKKESAYTYADSPRQNLKMSIRRSLTAVGTVVYLAVSFWTGAWYITWLVFPITYAINEIISACMDLKEAA